MEKPMTVNPVLRGFSPDPSVVKTPDGYLIATSTFEWFPGVRLFHSNDLSTWEELPSPLNRVSQLDLRGDTNSSGVWASDISFRDGVYYLVYTDVKTQTMGYYNTPNYLVWSETPRGPWSDPVYLNSSGFDPSLFHDEEKTWLVNMKNGFKGILIQEIDLETKKLMGEATNIFPGTSFGYTEGPHLYRRNGWYYLLVAEGGTGYGHCITQARSRTLHGPYENAPDNKPLLTSRDDSTLALQKAGHGDLVETDDGRLLLFFLCARPVPSHHRCVLGRETAVMPVVFTDTHWLALEDGGNHPRQLVDIGKAFSTPFPVDYRDDFNSPLIDIGWKRLRVPFGEDITLSSRPGWLSLFGRESINSLHRVTLIARKQENFKLRAETIMDAPVKCEEEQAGLVYLYNNAHFHLLVKTADGNGKSILVLFTCNAGTLTRKIEIALTSVEAGKPLTLALETDSEKAQFFWRAGMEGPLSPVGVPCDVGILTDEHARGFTGAHLGLYCHDMTGALMRADFDLFEIVTLNVSYSNGSDPGMDSHNW